DPEPVVWPADPPAQDAGRPSAEVDPAEAEATDEILAVLDGFRRVELEAYADPQPPHVARRDLSPYLADPLLSRTLGTLDTMLQTGVVYEGRHRWQPDVVDLQLDATPPTATIHDCLDRTQWRPVFRETGDPVPSDLPDRYLMRLDAKLFPDGWLLHGAAIEKETPC
ncbi:MAG: hypothetical protein ACRDT2_07620, partial [Natronosporangium sp.]